MTSRLTTVSFHCLLVGLAPLIDFDDHTKLLGVTIRNRCRRAPAPGDLLERRLHVAGRAVTRIDDQQVLYAADDKQLIIKEVSRVSGAQLRPSALRRDV